MLLQPHHLLGATQQEEADDGQDNRAAPEEEADAPPRGDTVGMFLRRRAYAVVDERRDHAEARVGRLEPQRPVGMFLATVPQSDRHDEAGADGALEETLQGSERHELRPVLAGADA